MADSFTEEETHSYVATNYGKMLQLWLKVGSACSYSS